MVRTNPTEARRAKGQGNASDVASILGVTPAAVKKAAAEGRIDRLPDGWYEVKTAVEQFRASSVGSRNGHAAAPADDDSDDSQANGGETFAAARTRKEIALADQAEVKAREQRAEVVSVAAAERMWFDLVRSTRSRIMALPDLLAGRMSGMTRAQIRNLLDSELRTALADLPETMPVQQ